jgi:uncharacterized protein
MLFATLLAATAMAATPSPLDATPQTRLDADLRCHLGVFDLADGGYLTITGNGGQPRSLQYTLSGRQFGTLQEATPGHFQSASLSLSFRACSAGPIEVGHAGTVQLATRAPLIERETRFISDGIALYGKLVLPAGRPARAVAVWIEGSNNNPSTDDTVWAYELARRGIGVFVYDKRGTGSSGGAQTSDFHARARDTAAAVQAARTLAPRVTRFGVIGASQGGWVGPLVATQVQLDFVVTAFGLAESPIAQDQALVTQQLRSAGHTGEALAQARQLTAITERIVRSNMADGLDDLDAFKIEHAGVGWIASIQPRSFTGLFLQFPSEVIRTQGPAMAQGLTFDFEPRPLIATIRPRQLWLLAGNDRQAPSARTQTILRQLQRRRSDLAVVVFPNADHGLIEPMTVDGATSPSYAAHQFDVAANWISTSALPGRGRFVTMEE